MIQYLVKKSLIFFFSLLSVVTITFLMMKNIPGDPFINDLAIPEEVLKALHRYYGLDKPLWMQYLHYIKGIFTLNFGPSLVYQGLSVNQIIKQAFPQTFLLGAQTLFFSLSIGTFLGVYSAFKRMHWQDEVVSFFSSIGLSIPNFLLASLLQYIFSVKLSILPVARWTGYAHTILPTIALGILPASYIARLIRASMIDVLSQDYIKTAYAKGLSSVKVLFKHALRNAFLPVLGYLTPLITYLLTGSFVIERVFAIPGLGQWMITSIQGRDYSTIIGLVVFYCTVLLLTQLILSIIAPLFDPRLKVRQS